MGQRVIEGGSVLYVVEGINPEPWAAAQASVGRKAGKFTTNHYAPEQMQVYKKALKDELTSMGVIHFGETELQLDFYFWRNVADYETLAGRAASAHVADATNLQKSTEDALQGILFKNDSQVRYVSSLVVEQSVSTDARVVISVTPFSTGEGHVAQILQRMDQLLAASRSDGVGPQSRQNSLPEDRGGSF